MQFDTCSNLHSVSTNVYTATSQAPDIRHSLKILKGVYQRYYVKYVFRKYGNENACLHYHLNFKEFSDDIHHGPLYYKDSGDLIFCS